ncbi:sigma 54-interacting transcriptional regulator [Terriglobus sp. ADX1]|uniref:sigma 54-interacting transcriptional regulator n=1 Tax=Terriglobus sp. ADX1 TaxID=2794063 RepID=UPI002FE6A75F
MAWNSYFTAPADECGHHGLGPPHIHKSVGSFEQADGGTLFLDEIGAMPFSVQPKLQRVLPFRSLLQVECLLHQPSTAPGAKSRQGSTVGALLMMITGLLLSML